MKERIRAAASLILSCTLPSAYAQPAAARVVIDAAQVEGRIDPRLYGQFIEFKGVKGGLSAELVRNRGFEGALRPPEDSSRASWQGSSPLVRE